MLYLISIFLFSCNENKIKTIPSNTQNSIITIIIKNKPTDFIEINQRKVKILNSFSYSDLDNPFKSYSINSTTKNDTLRIRNSENIVLEYSNVYQQFIFFVKKNDTLEILFNNNVPYAKLLNRNNIALNYDSKNKINTLDNNMIFFVKNGRFRNKIELKTFYNDYLDKHSEELKQLDSLYKNTKIKEYKIRHSICKYQKKAFILNNEERLKENNISFNKILYNDLKNKEHLSLKGYLWYLQSYIRHKHKIKLVKHSQGSIPDSRVAFDSVLTDKLLSTDVKHFLLYKYYEDIATNFSKIDSKKYYIKLNSKIVDKDILTKIKERYLINFNDKINNLNGTLLITIDKKNIKLKDLIEKQKGKIIYIDFWASWCAPCLKLMPDSKKLMNDFKNKDIIFIYISIDKDSDKWIKANKNEKLGNNSFLAINYPEAKFYEKLKLKSIPRYILFDKKGELIHENAPSPDSKEIRKIFKELLN